MLRNGVAPAVIWATSIALLGCDEPNPTSVDPDGVAHVAEIPAALADVSHVSGHVVLEATPTQNIRHESIAFTAVAGPVTTGQVEMHALRFTGQELRVHVQVTCLAVQEMDAWIGGRVTQFLLNGEPRPAQVGAPVVFRVRDAGEGAGVVDMSSLLLFNVPGGDLTYCPSRPAFPLLWKNVRGNLQVSE